MSNTQICPNYFKRGVLKEKDGNLVYEHNFMYTNPETNAVEFKFVYHLAELLKNPI
jgi:hypothetical protein